MADLNINVPEGLPPIGKLVNVTYTYKDSEGEDVTVTKECRLSYVFLDNATFNYKLLWNIEKTLTNEKTLEVEGTTWEEIQEEETPPTEIT